MISNETPDGKLYIDPSFTYTSIRVVTWHWPKTNACKAVGHKHPDSMYTAALTNFSDQLELQIEIETATLLGISALIDLFKQYLERFLQVSRSRRSYDLADIGKCQQIARKTYAIINSAEAVAFSELLHSLNAINEKSKFDNARLDEIKKLLSAIH